MRLGGRPEAGLEAADAGQLDRRHQCEPSQIDEHHRDRERRFQLAARGKPPTSMPAKHDCRQAAAQAASSNLRYPTVGVRIERLENGVRWRRNSDMRVAGKGSGVQTVVDETGPALRLQFFEP
jgi:hypothetical protein